MSCPKCGSWSVRRDRSLAGRMVCGRCGTPLGESAARAAQRGRGQGRLQRLGLRLPQRVPLWGWLLALVGLSAVLAALPSRSPLPSDPSPLPSGQLGR
ncbi:TFIIB-type zinc ribbon-containing protein [Cyanobium sp. ATX 6F1]|uniref:TFIIB-type zinc ribbon-containing protein n=1 Tax=Cyanobium sp. ATX 6F1 TaxID=2823702 RepID=UPI0020CC1767|nr:TFIIB-type zinc ribbon-containing protein [Cyanobium sp. ATX 6F1]MCP9915949.1 hypothetical protein [Cyanobium sp. ATX 6F1]